MARGQHCEGCLQLLHGKTLAARLHRRGDGATAAEVIQDDVRHVHACVRIEAAAGLSRGVRLAAGVGDIHGHTGRIAPGADYQTIGEDLFRASRVDYTGRRVRVRAPVTLPTLHIMRAYE